MAKPFFFMVSGAYGSYGGRPVDRKLRPRNLSKDGFEQMNQESQQFFPGNPGDGLVLRSVAKCFH